MLQNACENLRVGGFFIGTTVDSNELVSVREIEEEEKGMFIVLL